MRSILQGFREKRAFIPKKAHQRGQVLLPSLKTSSTTAPGSEMRR